MNKRKVVWTCVGELDDGGYIVTVESGEASVTMYLDSGDEEDFRETLEAWGPVAQWHAEEGSGNVIWSIG